MSNNKIESIKGTSKRGRIFDVDKTWIFTVSCIVAGLILVIIFIILNINKTYDNYSVIEEIVRNDSSTKEYLSYDEDKILRYSNDGITAMDDEGNLLWNGSYEMKNPKAVICGEYTAVADIGGTDVFIFNKKGNAEKIKNTLSIEQIEISEQGIVAMLVNDGMANYIKISDSTTDYIDIKTRIREDGYILDMAFSPDSKKLVVSSVSIESKEMKYNVTCYNLGEIGKSYESKIVAGYNYDNKMVPKVEFLNATTFAIFTEDNFEIYTMKEIPQNKFKSEFFKYKVKSIFCSNEYIGVALDNNDKYKTELIVYNLEGRVKLKKDISYEYKKIALFEDNIVMYTPRDAKIYDLSGNIKFDGNFHTNIEYILPYNNKEKYYFITSQNIFKVKLIKGD